MTSRFRSDRGWRIEPPGVLLPIGGADQPARLRERAARLRAEAARLEAEAARHEGGARPPERRE